MRFAILATAIICATTSAPAGQLCDAFYAKGQSDLGKACEADERERNDPMACVGCGVPESLLRSLEREDKQPERDYGAAAARVREWVLRERYGPKSGWPSSPNR